MFSLFSSFDNILMFFPKFSEILFLILVLITNYKFNFFTSLYFSLKTFLVSFMGSLKHDPFSKSVMLLFWSTMSLLLVMNIVSVFPFNFAYTSQMSTVLCLSLGIWSSLVIFSLWFNFKGFFSHLIPEGSPMPLVPALFLIEIVSSLIRPVTLTVRLVANILAGHLLLILLTKLVYSTPFSLPFHTFLNTVEFFVALIQSYIFLTMTSLYFCEVN